jgi:hypothetical protein
VALRLEAKAMQYRCNHLKLLPQPNQSQKRKIANADIVKGIIIPTFLWEINSFLFFI